MEKFTIWHFAAVALFMEMNKIRFQLFNKWSHSLHHFNSLLILVKSLDDNPGVSAALSNLKSKTHKADWIKCTQQNTITWLWVSISRPFAREWVFGGEREFNMEIFIGLVLDIGLTLTNIIYNGQLWDQFSFLDNRSICLFQSRSLVNVVNWVRYFWRHLKRCNQIIHLIYHAMRKISNRNLAQEMFSFSSKEINYLIH